MAHPLIRLDGVTKTYGEQDNQTHVLNGIDLTIAQGDFAALMGPSGSGKSTLLHILGLLDRSSSGHYFLHGEDVSGMDDDAQSAIRNREFGFVFQSFHLIPYVSAMENVLLPGMYGTLARRELEIRAKELLTTVGLADRIDNRPGQLSGGQQQRVALARALTNNPSVVFADEPTGQLDSSTSREIMDLFSRINQQGTTVVMVTHDTDTASHAKEVIRLLDGNIEER